MTGRTSASPALAAALGLAPVGRILPGNPLGLMESSRVLSSAR
ncbi:MAG: hypothetical protein OZ921_07750 [Sorangiineae bacterium]|nr:hypothetical protein [Polyangiaceae bacterium]MEB2322390.1 hypothetical protein [Sorangiineae bacterium]